MKQLSDYGIEMWDDAKISDFRRTLLAWYDREKRDLPWRRTSEPYKIWVSEIMLQQTQVVTVIPYYTRFLDWFPTVTTLANAPEEQLLKAWEGLGYYSRVRNMQTAARQIMSEFGGVFPNTHAGISSLKGIGPYTAGAIASIAFGLPEPAVDGNVMRVIARLFEVDYDIGDPKNRKIFQAIMERLIDPYRPGDFNQALMDLGADIESAKSPRPDESPIRAFCAAYLNGTYDKYPIKAPKKKPRPMQIQAFVIRNSRGDFLLEKNTEERLLGGFWSFPIIELMDNDKKNAPDTDKNPVTEISQTYLKFEQDYQLHPLWTSDPFSPVSHVFSHQKWNIVLIEGTTPNSLLTTTKELKWVALEDFDQYPMATPQKKMLKTYLKESKFPD